MSCYLLSYPRSGVTWLRYCIEELTGFPTLGSNEDDLPICNRVGVDLDVDPDKNFIAYKRHSWRSGEVSENDYLVLVLRNPVEVMSRRYEKEGHSLQNTLNSNIPQYVENIRKFDEFGGSKHVVYYEDIIQDGPLKHALEQFLDVFPSASEHRLESIMQNIDYHRKTSLESYPQSYSQGEDEVYYDREVSSEVREKFASRVVDLTTEEEREVYLSRYDEIS